MKTINILLLFLILFSCTTSTKQSEEEVVEVKLTKLEELLLLPTDTVMDYYDLSNDSISEFPDLSSYTIKSLDLSHNQLDTVIVDYMPKDIVSLNLSHNVFEGILDFSIDPKYLLSFEERDKLYDKYTIREIDLSYNKLTYIVINFPLRKIDISHNDIIAVSFEHRNIEYLDISNNPNMSNVVGFVPMLIDTLIHNNIANDKKLRESSIYILPNDSL
ncbi:MAG: hypothetical protein GXZ03_01465 [Proteiniphilum sp.]|nr:hypothetical protein [Proteiniphilum sp.]